MYLYSTSNFKLRNNKYLQLKYLYWSHYKIASLVENILTEITYQNWPVPTKFLSETNSVRTIISYNYKILLNLIILNEIKNISCDITPSWLVNHYQCFPRATLLRSVGDFTSWHNRRPTPSATLLRVCQISISSFCLNYAYWLLALSHLTCTPSMFYTLFNLLQPFSII